MSAYFSNRSYLLVTAHWLDNDFSPVHKCVAVKPVPRDHSTQSITSLLNDVIDELSMDRNNLYVVSSVTIKDAITQVVYIDG